MDGDDENGLLAMYSHQEQYYIFYIKLVYLYHFPAAILFSPSLFYFFQNEDILLDLDKTSKALYKHS